MIKYDMIFFLQIRTNTISTGYATLIIYTFFLLISRQEYQSSLSDNLWFTLRPQETHQFPVSFAVLLSLPSEAYPVLNPITEQEFWKEQSSPSENRGTFYPCPGNKKNCLLWYRHQLFLSDVPSVQWNEDHSWPSFKIIVQGFRWSLLEVIFSPSTSMILLTTGLMNTSPGIYLEVKVGSDYTPGFGLSSTSHVVWYKNIL